MWALLVHAYKNMYMNMHVPQKSLEAARVVVLTRANLQSRRPAPVIARLTMREVRLQRVPPLTQQQSVRGPTARGLLLGQSPTWPMRGTTA